MPSKKIVIHSDLQFGKTILGKLAYFENFPPGWLTLFTTLAVGGAERVNITYSVNPQSPPHMRIAPCKSVVQTVVNKPNNAESIFSRIRNHGLDVCT